MVLQILIFYKIKILYESTNYKCTKYPFLKTVEESMEEPNDTVKINVLRLDVFLNLSQCTKITNEYRHREESIKV